MKSVIVKSIITMLGLIFVSAAAVADSAPVPIPQNVAIHVTIWSLTPKASASNAFDAVTRLATSHELTAAEARNQLSQLGNLSLMLSSSAVTVLGQAAPMNMTTAKTFMTDAPRKDHDVKVMPATVQTGVSSIYTPLKIDQQSITLKSDVSLTTLLDVRTVTTKSGDILQEPDTAFCHWGQTMTVSKSHVGISSCSIKGTKQVAVLVIGAEKAN